MFCTGVESDEELNKLETEKEDLRSDEDFSRAEMDNEFGTIRQSNLTRPKSFRDLNLLPEVVQVEASRFKRTTTQEDSKPKLRTIKETRRGNEFNSFASN